MLQDVLQFGEVHAPSTPYTSNHEGQGPAWANSLFEDNAEYGFRYVLRQLKHIRNRIADICKVALESDIC